MKQFAFVALAASMAVSAQVLAGEVVFSPSTNRAVRSIRVNLPDAGDPVLLEIAGVFARQVQERCVSTVSIGHGEPATKGSGEVWCVSCRIDPAQKPESFQISDDLHGNGVVLAAGSPRGILYGLGKLLRGSCFDPGGFIPGAWRGASVPEKPMRAIYFATHFHNFYHEAPIEDVERYVQDMGLWGYNTVIVWFDMHHFKGMEDPAAKQLLLRLRAILGAAKKIGLQSGLTVLANEAYANSPLAMRAEDPKCSRADFYGVEICPHKPGALDLMLTLSEQRFAAFRDIGVDYIMFWPYDQGGCGCPQCKPWGSNGYLVAARPIAEQARRLFPKAQIILSTWLFDAQEWEGLSAAFAAKPEWVDNLLADSHGDFPRYPVEKGVPGGLPLLSFPEISMWGCSPWGSHGANPLPARFQKIWEPVRMKLSGGMPYSEGIYEDMNKAVFSQFYWDSTRPALETLKEYAAFEFSPAVADDVVRAIQILEKNHTWPGTDAGSQQALDLLQLVDGKLTAQARTSWRWRILYLRGVLDREHYASPGKTTEAGRQATLELIRIYHAEKADPFLRMHV